VKIFFNNRLRIVFILLLLFGNSIKSFSQSAFISQNPEAVYYLQRFEVLSGKISDQLHLSSLPYQRKMAVAFLDSLKVDSLKSSTDQNSFYYLLTDFDEWSNYDGAKSKKPFLKQLYKNKADFYQYRSDDFMVKVNPVFDFEIGKDKNTNELLFQNTRGLDVKGWIAKRVGYRFLLTENQARFPLYVRERTDSLGALPYQGYYKDFKTEGVDYFDANGYFDFTVAKFITVQFGHGKNFLGNGIRSLAISDFSENYLFLKLQTQVWKIQYQNLFMDLTADFLRGGDQLLPKKYAAINSLSINATKFLNVGVWESVVFHRNDGFELQYLNPIIFYRSIEQMIGSPDNAMLGLEYRINFLKRFSYYGQLMLDDYNFQTSKGEQGYWGNKYGYQQGIKYMNAFSVSNLDLQFEWNNVRPYTYTHNDSIANYSNYNQQLAHPLGANFNELIGIVRYQPIFPLIVRAKIVYAVQGRDTSNSNFGADIFIPTTENNVASIYGNETGQGVGNRLLNFGINVSYMIKHNFYADVAYTYRKTNSDYSGFNSSTHIFQIGVRLNFERKAYDF
jgi:hypothetical protein